MLKFFIAGAFACSIILPTLAADKDTEFSDPTRGTPTTILENANESDAAEENPPPRRKKKKKVSEVAEEQITPPPHEKQIGQINPVPDDFLTPRRDTADVVININDMDDLAAAHCKASCLKTGRGFASGASGWCSLINSITKTAKPFVTSLATVSYFSTEIKQKLGIAGTILNGVSIASGMLADEGVKYAIKNQKKLAEIQTEMDQLLKKNQPHNGKLKAAASAILSEDDHVKFQELMKRAADLTSLSKAEKTYFRFANCFWGSTSTVSGLLGILCKVGSLVMLPLTTLPKWDPQTDAVLNLVTLSLEGGSLFFDHLSQNAKEIEAQRAQLQATLESIKATA